MTTRNASLAIHKPSSGATFALAAALIGAVIAVVAIAPNADVRIGQGQAPITQDGRMTDYGLRVKAAGSAVTLVPEGRESDFGLRHESTLPAPAISDPDGGKGSDYWFRAVGQQR